MKKAERNKAITRSHPVEHFKKLARRYHCKRTHDAHHMCFQDQHRQELICQIWHQFWKVDYLQKVKQPGHAFQILGPCLTYKKYKWIKTHPKNKISQNNHSRTCWRHNSITKGSQISSTDALNHCKIHSPFLNKILKRVQEYERSLTISLYF